MNKKTIEDCNALAIENDGYFLSSSYKNSISPLLWQCNNGHKWFACYSSIKNSKSWCPYCAGQIKHNIEECKNIAIKKGGLCLSNKYISTDSMLEWKCSFGHIWQTSFKKINFGHWCPKCANVQKLDLNTCKFIAKQNNGECLSDFYKNNKTKMLWKCSFGHIWESTLTNIKDRKRWCPECSEGKNQKLLCNIIKKIFPTYTVFSNYRGFDWLKIDTHHKQEIDIFVYEIGLAIEYDGIQHFKAIKFFGGDSSFDRIKKLDIIKNKKIKEHPKDIKYFIRFNYNDNLNEFFISSELRKIGITI